MVEHIYTLRQSLSRRSVYLCDLGRDTMTMFYYLATRGEDVRGFVTNFHEYVGSTIMNRPVLSETALGEDGNAIIIAPDDAGRGAFAIAQQGGECLRWSDALELNPLLEGTHLFVYGAGEKAWEFIKMASESKLDVRGFVSDDPAKSHHLLGLPVLSPHELPVGPDVGVVVMGDKRREEESALLQLEESRFGGIIFLRELAASQDMWAFGPFIMIDAAVKSGERILFCCDGPIGREVFRRALSVYGVHIDREVGFRASAEEGIEDIWSLADENPAESVPLVHATAKRRRHEIVEAANDLGFDAGEHTYAATNIAYFNRLSYTDAIPHEYDDKLVYSIDYSPIGGLPGWARFGTESDRAKRIMIVGGSTSSEIFRPESWASKLYELICAHGKDAVIYNGAHASNGIREELYQLVRDIRWLKPDIVISMSGFNDLSLPNNKFERARGESAFDFWVRMEGYMKLIAESEGASFFAFLQPINQGLESPSLHDILVYHKKAHWRCCDIWANKREGDGYYDLFELFLHQDEFFIDYCHYSDLGNEKLAEKVYEIIEDRL